MTSRQKAAAIIKSGVPFFIGALTGLVGQTLIPMASEPLDDTPWAFGGLVSDIGIYPFLIVFMIYRRDKSPQIVFKRIFLFFVGLCVGYYLWTTFLGLRHAIESGHKEAFGSVFLSDLFDGAVYGTIGFFAALWGAAMVRLKGNKRMAAYYVMTVPFIIVEVFYLCFSLMCVVPQIMMALVELLCLAAIIVFMVKAKKEFSDADTAVYFQQEN